MQPAYRYRAELVRVIDADTLLLAIDLGFRASLRVPIRLRGWNAAERNTKRGQKAIRFVEELLAACEDVVVETYKDRQSFARWGGGRVDGR